MRTGITLVEVTKAADELLARGERPTIEGVRTVLGTGSPATVNAHLKAYFQALPTRLHLPASIATAAAELYEKIRSTALEEATEQRTELEQQMTVERNALAEDRRAFDTERSDLLSAAATLTADVDRLKEQLRQLSTKHAALERELASQTTRAAAAEAQARSSDEERDRTALRHQAELQRQREQAEGNERHLLARIDEHKTQLQRLQVDRDREVAASTKRLTDLEASLADSLKGQASLQAELAKAQRDIVKRQEALSAAEAALQRSQELSAKSLSAQKAELDRARIEIEQVGSAIDRHKKERDEAVREAAKLEGKLSSQQSQLDEAKAEIRRLQRERLKPDA